jgi:hypothetical protein
MESLEQFEKNVQAKRERLLKDISLAKALPTANKTITWTGENGWEADGNTRKPDVERTIEIAPYIVYTPFRGHEHVAFRAPDSYDGIKGEHVSSKYRTSFVKQYLNELLNVCEPFIIPSIATRGTYAGTHAATYDYKANRDYKDAVEVARGFYEITVSNGSGYTSATLYFYIHTEATGTVEISFDISRDFATWKLQARAQYDNDRHNAVPARWNFPSLSDVGAVNLFKRANADRNSYGQPSGYTLEWLFDSREAMEKAINEVR